MFNAKTITFAGHLLDPSGRIFLDDGSTFTTSCYGAWLRVLDTGLFGTAQEIALCYRNGGAEDVAQLRWDPSDNQISLFSVGTNTPTGVFVSIGTWFFGALSRNATNTRLFYATESIACSQIASVSSAGGAPTQVVAGARFADTSNLDASTFDGDMTGLLLYQGAELTSTQWETQRTTGLNAVSTSSLYAQWPSTTGANAGVDTFSTHSATQSGTLQTGSNPGPSFGGGAPPARNSIFSFGGF